MLQSSKECQVPSQATTLKDTQDISVGLLNRKPSGIPMRQLLLAISLVVISLTAEAGDLGDQFITAKLAYGSRIDIPRSWHVMRGNELRAIETTVGAVIDLSGSTKSVDGTESLLVASFPDSRLYGGVAVTSTAIRGSTRSSVATLSDAQVKSGELTIRQGLEAMLAQLGGRAWAWTPLKKVTFAGTTVLHISYLRSSEAGDRRVHIYKFFATGRIFDLALSTSVANEDLNRVVLTKILNSFVAP